MKRKEKKREGPGRERRKNPMDQVSSYIWKQYKVEVYCEHS